MGRFVYLQSELGEATKSKFIKEACDNGDLVIVYFPRDNAYYFAVQKVSDATLTRVRKELNKLYPNIREMRN